MASLGIRGAKVTPEEAKIIWQRVRSPSNQEWFATALLISLVSIVLLFPPGGFGKDGIGFATNKKTAHVVMECCCYLSFVTMGCVCGVCVFGNPSNDMQIQRLVKVMLNFLIAGFALLGSSLVAMLW